MRPFIIRSAASLFILLALTTCRVTAQGPTAWIDRPLDGDQVRLEPLTIQAHASDSDGVTRFEFFVGDTPLGTVPASGSRFAEAEAGWVPSASGTYLVRVRAADSGGSVGTEATARVIVGGPAVVPPTPNVVPATTFTPFPTAQQTAVSSELQLTFTTDRTSLNQGECATLRWDVRGPVGLVQFNGQSVDRSGQAQVCPAQTTTYSLNASAVDSESIKHGEILVSVDSPVQPPGCPGPPAIGFFNADPSTITAGQSTTLSWGAITNATSAVIDQGIGGSAMAGGTYGPLSPTTTTTFTLSATGCGGTTTKQVMVVVNPAQPPPPPPPQPPVCPGPPVIASFNANPSTIAAGQSSTLAWGLVTNATSAVIDPDIGGVGTPGSTTVEPATTQTYTLTANGCGGTVRRQVTVVVNAALPPPPPPRDSAPPAVSNVGANPGSLVEEGTGCSRTSRTTTVSATVTDAGGVNRVVARVLGTGIEVPMTRSDGNTFQAVLGPFNETGSLSIVVIATDNAGNSAQGGPVSVLVQPCID